MNILNVAVSLSYLKGIVWDFDSEAHHLLPLIDKIPNYPFNIQYETYGPNNRANLPLQVKYEPLERLMDRMHETS